MRSFPKVTLRSLGALFAFAPHVQAGDFVWTHVGNGGAPGIASLNGSVTALHADGADLYVGATPSDECRQSKSYVQPNVNGNLLITARWPYPISRPPMRSAAWRRTLTMRCGGSSNSATTLGADRGGSQIASSGVCAWRMQAMHARYLSFSTTAGLAQAR